jgi:hypothetical protein
MQTLRAYRSFDRPVQVAVFNMLVNNVGFYMLVPFLAGYMANDLGLALWIVGLVLGIRTLSQQGLSLIGGSLGDRFGYKPTIVAGCVLRTVAFALFGLVDSAGGLIAAAILTGLGGALLSPAARAYVAPAAGSRRVEAFALFDATLHGGSLLGPLIGSLLLGFDFRLVCFAASAMFALVGLLQWRFLPDADIPVDARGGSLLRSWGEPLKNRAFMLFTLSLVGYFFLYNQVYLGLPLEVRRLTGSDASVGLLFTMLALVGILGQVPVTLAAKERLRPPTAIVAGLVLMGLAFLPLMATAATFPISADRAAAWLGSAAPGVAEALAGPLALAVSVAPLALCCALLIGGQMLAAPFVSNTVASLSAGRLTGTYFGVYALLQGVGAALGNFAGGAAFDVARGLGSPGLPWLLMTAVGLACALGMAALDRSGLLARAARDARRPVTEDGAPAAPAAGPTVPSMPAGARR